MVSDVHSSRQSTLTQRHLRVYCSVKQEETVYLGLT